MRALTPTPDASPPGVRRLVYAVFCWLNRHPSVLRRFGKLFRGWPSLGHPLGMVARADAVKRALKRPQSFSNTSHAEHLVAGDFLIGMDAGHTYADDKALVKQRLACLGNLPANADQEAQKIVAELGQKKSFDLIENYLLWVVFRAIAPVFGNIGGGVAGHAGGNAYEQRQFLLEVRYVAGQLFKGNDSPLRVQRRAELAAASLCARTKRVSRDIRKAWDLPGSCASNVMERNAMGLAWVSHPVTVQAAALIVQELLGRAEVYRALREKAKQHGATVWTDAGFRDSVRAHVLELMRFRPVFPALARHVPRDTELETGARRNARRRGGGSVLVFSLAALFDPRAVCDSDRFHPDRKWCDEDLRYLMFGYGDRQCPAKDHAVDAVTSALIGLLTLPELRLAGDGKPIAYDGPMMSRMRLCFG
jgi:cytochrome P450